MGSGRWQARFPRDLDPTTRPVPGGPWETEAEAWAAIAVAIREVEAGRLVLAMPDDPPPAPPQVIHERTVKEMMDDFLVEHTGLAINTLKRYRGVTTHIICSPAIGIGDRTLRSLTPGSLNVWRRGLDVTHYNRKQAWAVLRSALSWEVENDRLTVNPAFGVRVRRTSSEHAEATHDPVRLPTWAQFHQMVCHPYSHRDKVLLALLGWCGLRFSEAAALEPSDFLVATREIRVKQQWVKAKGQPWVVTPLKTGEIRTVPVPYGLWRHIKRLLDNWTPPTDGRKPVLFTPNVEHRGGPGVWNPSSFRRVVMVPLQRDTGLDIRAKDLRAYAASAIVDAGGSEPEAQRLLGHRHPMTTRNHYLRAQASQAHDPARAALRIRRTLTLAKRLDALYVAWVNRFGDPFVG